MITRDPDIKLTKSFKLKEFCVSSDHPHLVERLFLTVPKYTDNLFYLCHFILQHVRDKFGVPVHISSAYRDDKLNAKVGGASNSLHKKGKAADIYTDNMELLPAIFEYIKTELIGMYGELLLYRKKDGTPRFIHVSLPEHGKHVKINDEVIK